MRIVDSRSDSQDGNHFFHKKVVHPNFDTVLHRIFHAMDRVKVRLKMFRTEIVDLQTGFAVAHHFDKELVLPERGHFVHRFDKENVRQHLDHFLHRVLRVLDDRKVLVNQIVDLQIGSEVLNHLGTELVLPERGHFVHRDDRVEADDPLMLF